MPDFMTRGYFLSRPTVAELIALNERHGVEFPISGDAIAIAKGRS